MPKAVGVTFGDFLKIESELKKLGFVEMTRREVLATIFAHGLKHFGKVWGGEIGFKYFENGYIVRVWTGCLRKEVYECRKLPLATQEVVVSRPANEDMGWILIANTSNKAEYFARPTLRTKNFVRTLLRRAWITQRKVQRRPLCKKCGKYMEIHRQTSGATFWECLEKARHKDGKPCWEDWDVALGPRALKIAEGWRREYHRYLDREKKKGNIPHRASTIRKGWKATKNPYPDRAA